MEAGGPTGLVVEEEVLRLLEARGIRLEAVAETIAEAEKCGVKFVNREDGLSLAFHRKGNATTWVEYKMADGGYVVRSAWSHRIWIKMVGD